MASGEVKGEGVKGGGMKGMGGWVSSFLVPFLAARTLEPTRC